MNSIKIKLINYYLLDKKNPNQGFINIYYLVGFLIIGLIIGANIIILKYLNQCGKCGSYREAYREASQNISMVNRTQALTLIEGGEFADNFDDLYLGNLSGGNIDFRSSKYYTYIIKTKEDRALIQAIPKAIPKDLSEEENQYESGGNLKVTVGEIFVSRNSNNQIMTREIICEAKEIGQVIDPADIVLKDGELQCPEGSQRRIKF